MLRTQFLNASNKPRNLNFHHFDTNHFQIPELVITENEIKLNLQELYDLSMNPANPKYVRHMDSTPTFSKDWKSLPFFSNIF